MAVVGPAFLVARRENHLGRLGEAVAGDYAESPAEPQLLLQQINYCLLVLLCPVCGVEVLPEPTPEPLLAAPGVVGVLLAPLELEPILPADEPEPALLRSSRRQVSRCAPVSPTHLLASLPDAPVDALPDVPEVLVSAEPELEGEVVLLPDEPAPVAPDDELPMLPEDAPVPLLPAPEPEPEDCAIAALESASRAAAVAAVRVFNIM